MLKTIIAAYSPKGFGEPTSAASVYSQQLQDAQLELAKWQHHADQVNSNVEMLAKRVERLKGVVNGNA